MVKTLPSAKITLSCPLWACDFDPHDANQLVVGGGGGAGRHGVGNKIVCPVLLILDSFPSFWFGCACLRPIAVLN